MICKRNYICLFIVLLIFSCTSNRKQVERPYYKMNETSQIYLPFSLSRKDLIRSIDKFVPDTLYRRKRDDDFPVDLEIYKGEIIDLKLIDSTLLISVSLDMKISRSVFGFSATSDASMYLDFSTKISINDDWDLSTNSSIDSYEWINRPEINLFGIKISVPDFLIKYFDSRKSNWIESIDTYISKTKFLKDKIVELNSYTKKTFPIDSAESIGAKFRVNSFSISYFRTIGDTIFGGVGIDFDTKIVPYDSLAEIHSDIENIKFRWNREINRQKIVFSIAFTEKELQEYINHYMSKIREDDRVLNMSDNNIRLDMIDAMIVNDLVGGKVFFSGDKRGEIVFLVRPFWNEDEKRILFLNRDIKISMEDFKSKALLMLFGKKAKSQLADIMENKINKLIYDAIYEINDSISTIENLELGIEKFHLPVQVEQRELFLDVDIEVLGSFKMIGIGFDILKKCPDLGNPDN